MKNFTGLSIPKIPLLSMLLFMMVPGHSFAQETGYRSLGYAVDGNDTIPVVEIKGVDIYSVRTFKSRRETEQNNRLIRNVKRVYPYAKLAGEKLREYELILNQTESERERRKILKELEDEINEKYGEELKKLTFSQGKILIKLIDRETGSSTYNLVQDLRGNFLAFFYQSFARIFGYNLKVKYDPLGEDRNIEIIVRMIELGLL